jgi:hypothetical protein
MNKKVWIRTLVVSVGMIATLTLFNNCSQDLPTEAKSYASEATPASVTPADPGSGPAQLTALSLTLNPSTIFADQTAQAVTTGGQPPYSYSVLSGMARIDSTGAISGPLAAGSVIIKISDQANQSQQVVLTVNARPVAPPPGTPPAPTYLSCVTPFGPSIPHGASITAFQTATIYCPSTAQCASETRVCNNGTLSGSYTASSCSTRACVYKATDYARDQQSGLILCQISYNDNGTVVAAIGQVADASKLPPSCPASQYKSGVICQVQVTQNGSGENEFPSYSYTKYTCRGANETVMPMLYQYQDPGGGGGGSN